MKLIADDFGYGLAINEGILCLLEQRRINGTSCMMGAEFINHDADRLLDLKNSDPSIELGLHLTLTDKFVTPLTTQFPNQRYLPLSKLILNAQLGLLNLMVIQNEFDAQLDAFEALFNQPPDYIDGHQHVHCLPQIRDALVELLVRRQYAGWVRQCSAPMSKWMIRPARRKSAIIAVLNRGFKKTLSKNDLSYNSDFSGIYDFMDREYKRHLKRWARTSRSDTVIMCHPAHSNLPPMEEDVIASARYAEFNALMSDKFHHRRDRAI